MANVESYERPATIEAALASLRLPRALPLGGGTALNSAPTREPVTLVDLQALHLDSIEAEGECATIGACATLQTLVEHPALPRAVREAACRELPSTLRAAATVGGCVALAEPDSELFAALLAHDAVVCTATGRREPLAAGPVLGLADFVTLVEIDLSGDCAWARTARTRADRPVVAAFARQPRHGAVRLALAGVGERPLLVDPEALDELEPPSDFRGSAGYRRALAAIVARRALEGVA